MDKVTANDAARALHDLGMEVDPSNRKPLERLAADLNGHVAEPFRSCLNSAVNELLHKRCLQGMRMAGDAIAQRIREVR